MDLQVIHDKDPILKFLKKNPGLYIYSIGDLDDFFWPKTIWYALTDSDEIKSLALLYVGMDTPTLILLYEGEASFSHLLIEKIKPFLPVKINAHLSEGLVDTFGRQNILNYYGLNYKMILNKVAYSPLDPDIRKLSPADLPQISELYSVSYPQNWFDSHMLETNKYYGYFKSGILIGIAGIHVYSEEYKVAGLGNIATHPDHRGKQIGYKLTSELCFDLQRNVDLIGLNVWSENEHAIKCYRKIGFEIIGTYEEYYLKNDFNSRKSEIPPN
jgi:ribosomal protein S18 acetylase RimI-like enzyme